MVGKRGITPVVAVILLIVMTVGIAAFTFVWMQNFISNLQQTTQQQFSQMQRPSFAISNVVYDGKNKVSFMLSNIGTVPINVSKVRASIKGYWIINGSYAEAPILNKKPSCENKKILGPQDSTICNVTGVSELNLDQKYYILIVSYAGVEASARIE